MYPLHDPLLDPLLDGDNSNYLKGDSDGESCQYGVASALHGIISRTPLLTSHFLYIAGLYGVGDFDPKKSFVYLLFANNVSFAASFSTYFAPYKVHEANFS